ncbi:MAG: PHP domain-containing protein [Clostridia bacterium]|nr:PHP domain-containing protein [Clostridia bacterium]
MRFILDQDLHLHSHLSSCSRDPEQTPARILQHAKENGLSTLCLTDHYWDSAIPGASNWYAPQNFDHIAASCPLPQADGVRLLFGCETELRRDLTLGIPRERYDAFDFIVIPTTHLHMTGFTLSEEDAASLESRARLWVERLDAVLGMDLPFRKVGVAHLACGLLAPKPRENYLNVLDMIPTSQMERVFQKAAARGIGIELNMDDMRFADSEADTVLRPFRIAKRQGCKFYTASDAHHPAHFGEYRALMERAIGLLELEESDKFHI